MLVRSYHFSQHRDASGHLRHVLHLDQVVEIKKILFRNAKSSQILQQNFHAPLSVRPLQGLELVTLLTVTVVPVVTVALLSNKAGAVMVVVVAVVRVGEVFLHEALMSFEFGRLGF